MLHLPPIDCMQYAKCKRIPGSGGNAIESTQENETKKTHRPVNYPNLNEVVREAIEERILSGSLAPGDKVAEAELASLLEVSRTPVKLALIELAKEGIVDVVPRRGAFVKVFSRDDITKVQQVRAALEGLAGRLAAAVCTEEDSRTLRDLVEEYRKLGDISDHETGAKRREIETKMKRLDLDFHNRILDMSGNEYLISVARRKNLQFQCFINEAWGNRNENRKRVMKEHEEIIKALREHDDVGSEALLKYHIAGHEIGHERRDYHE